jgi:hypothetical protein
MSSRPVLAKLVRPRLKNKTKTKGSEYSTKGSEYSAKGSRRSWVQKWTQKE